MLRPRRDIQISLRHKKSSSPRFSQNNNRSKRRRIDPKIVDQNNVDLALAVIAPAPECTDESPTLISTELSHFDANYVENRCGEPHYTSLSKINFFKLFFSDFVVEILFEEINVYAKS